MGTMYWVLEQIKKHTDPALQQYAHAFQVDLLYIPQDLEWNKDKIFYS